MPENDKLIFSSDKEDEIVDQNFCEKEKENPWKKLYLHWTNSFKKRASITKHISNNNDSLDLKLNALYSHHHQWLETAAGIVLQSDTLEETSGLCKKFDTKKEIEKDKGNIRYGVRNHPIYITTMAERRRHINTNKSMTIESSHVPQTKNGYDRNLSGGFFYK